MPLRLYLSVLCVLCVLCGSIRAAQAQDAPTFDERLEQLVEKLDAERIDQHIPGMALAVVKDDEIVLARGFGLADVETGREVTPETIFAVGSTTKAFTGALVGMLVDEGKMGWDDAASKHVAGFEMPVRGDEVATIRDLLAHRTGFTRMGLLWAGGGATRDQILETAVKAEPWDDHRKTFLYNNVMYMAAGVAAGNVAGSDWETLMHERLLAPLGMSDSTLSTSDVEGHERLALGYLWEEERDDWRRLPMRNLDSIGPAGSINSTVLDMARWVRLQLGKGEFEGTRFLSEEALDETWSPAMEIAPGVDYGIGWMLRDWNGKGVVEHGGNIDGFAAAVAMIPEEQLGFVLLMNISAAPLQQACLPIVWDTLLGDPREPGAVDYAPYIGKYVVDFGQWNDDRFTVEEKDGRLTIDIPGQMAFELKDPDDEGKWYFALTDTISIEFEMEDDRVIALYMNQGGARIEMPREGVEPKIEVPLDELRQYLGTYHDDGEDMSVEVLIHQNRLAVDVPGQMKFALHPPDDEGWWNFRALEGFRVTFLRDDAGAVTGLRAQQPGNDATLSRVEGDPADAVPTAAELAERYDHAGRQAAFDALGVVRIAGNTLTPQAGIEGTMEWIFGAGGRMRQNGDLGVFGQSTAACDGERAWRASSFEPWHELLGAELRYMKASHPSSLAGDWSLAFDSIDVLRADERDDRPVWVVRMSNTEGESKAMVWVDQDTGDAMFVETAIPLPGLGALPVTVTMSDYRDIGGGVRIPFSIVTSNDATGRDEVSFEEVEVGVEVDDTTWVVEEDDWARKE